jgi:hypothetical protein
LTVRSIVGEIWKLQNGNWKVETRDAKMENGNRKLDIRKSKMETRKSGLLHFCPLPFDLLSAEALSCAVTFSLSPVACPLVLARHWSLILL